MSLIAFFQERPKLLGGICVFLGAVAIVGLLYFGQITSSANRSWQSYPVETVRVSVEGGLKGPAKTYYFFETDQAVDVKTGSRNAELFDIAGISNLKFPQDLGIYSTHEIKTPPNGDRIIWVEGVRDSQGKIYLDPIAAAELLREDLKVGYVLGAIFILLGLLMMLFIKPKRITT